MNVKKCILCYVKTTLKITYEGGVLPHLGLSAWGDSSLGPACSHVSGSHPVPLTLVSDHTVWSYLIEAKAPKSHKMRIFECQESST